MDPFEDTDVGESKQPVMKFQFNELKKYFIDIMIGRGPFLNRSVNILHVLGSVTVSNLKLKFGKFKKIRNFPNLILIIKF